MHRSALETMTGVIDSIQGDSLGVLDVGSLDVNGSYRPLIENKGWQYTGLDVRPGRNVDIIADDPFHYPLDDNTYDVIISGSTMEHVTAVWRWLPELVRVLKPGGFLAIVTHWRYPEHRYPVDCWRILPDGMQFLFDETKQLTDYDIRITNDTDILGVGRKHDS